MIYFSGIKIYIFTVYGAVVHNNKILSHRKFNEIHLNKKNNQSSVNTMTRNNQPCKNKIKYNTLLKHTHTRTTDHDWIYVT